MNKNLTEIIFLLDKSGSMQSMGSEPYQGFNEFIKQQKDPDLGEANVTLVLFGSDIQEVYESIPINSVPELTSNEYKANGMTCLRDAIGQTFSKAGARLAAIPENDRPGKVMVVILTDGEDTSSKEYSTENIKDIINTQSKKYSWNIQFMGTTKEAILAAHSFNIMSGNISTFDNSTRGITASYTAASTLASAYRSSN